VVTAAATTDPLPPPSLVFRFVTGVLLQVSAALTSLCSPFLCLDLVRAVDLLVLVLAIAGPTSTWHPFYLFPS
jgi:hypothetical protein